MADIKTHIATFDATSITVRGKDLVRDLIGHRSFTEMVYFLACNRFPTPTETQVLDACLVTLMEHGFNRSSLITRLTHDSLPGQPQVAMAAGLLAVGDVFVGTIEDCARIVRRGVEEGGDPDAYCRRVVAEWRASGKAVPGFGHPHHSPDDPRTPRLLEIAKTAGVSGVHVTMLQRLGLALDEARGHHLTINATGGIAALLLEIGIPVDAMRCVAVVSRAGGLVGHVLEERQSHSARLISELARTHIPYEDPETH